jgi:hypothetical protein
MRPRRRCGSAPRVAYTTRTFNVQAPRWQSKMRSSALFERIPGIKAPIARQPQSRGREPHISDSSHAIAMSNPEARPPNCLTPAVRRAGIEVRQARAKERAADLAPIVKELQAAGVTSLKGIAAALNERGILTREVAVIGMRRRSRGC